MYSNICRCENRNGLINTSALSQYSFKNVWQQVPAVIWTFIDTRQKCVFHWQIVFLAVQWWRPTSLCWPVDLCICESREPPVRQDALTFSLTSGITSIAIAKHKHSLMVKSESYNRLGGFLRLWTLLVVAFIAIYKRNSQMCCIYRYGRPNAKFRTVLRKPSVEIRTRCILIIVDLVKVRITF